MLQECNKFREHQAREGLIELLQSQLEARRRLAAGLRSRVAEADKHLADCSGDGDRGGPAL
jgi:hypothetical protein